MNKKISPINGCRFIIGINDRKAKSPNFKKPSYRYLENTGSKRVRKVEREVGEI